MKRIGIIAVLFIVASAISVVAQDDPIPPQARLIDEFGRLGDCDLRARFDQFYIELQNDRSLSGYVIFYNGRDMLPVYYDAPVHERIFANHTTLRRFDRSRITLVRGGFRDEMTTQLWLVPKGAESPKPVDSEPVPALPHDVAFKFDAKTIYEGDRFVLESVKERERLELASEFGWEMVESENEVAFDEDELADEEDDIDDTYSWFSREFAAYLLSHPESTGVILFYADDQRVDIGMLHSYIVETISKFEQDGISIQSRAAVRFGGHRMSENVEFFVVPRGAKEPTASPSARMLDSDHP